MARFSGPVALFIVSGELSAVRRAAAVALVLLCWIWSTARLDPVGLDR
jgi:hypothetical protein